MYQINENLHIIEYFKIFLVSLNLPINYQTETFIQILQSILLKISHCAF